MSSIFFNLGTPAHNRAIPYGGYVSTKGRPPFNNPIGRTTGNIRPLTNNDPTNNTVQRFGLPRPIKHYRNGIVQSYEDDYSRQVRSYHGANRMVTRLMDYPGEYTILSKVDKPSCLDNVVSTWKPSVTLTDNPSEITDTPAFCCNAEQKALQRVLPANTNLKKTYYTTNSAYLYNKCQTFDQRQFNYITSGNPVSKPGGPLSETNMYASNCASACISDTTDSQNGCSNVIYKPNNYKFAHQGAVSSSTRLLQITVDALKYKR
jgi:hypothetical protein